MHHPTDVLAAFLNGGVCVAVVARSVLDRNVAWAAGPGLWRHPGADRAARKPADV